MAIANAFWQWEVGLCRLPSFGPIDTEILPASIFMGNYPKDGYGAGQLYELVQLVNRTLANVQKPNQYLWRKLDQGKRKQERV